MRPGRRGAAPIGNAGSDRARRSFLTGVSIWGRVVEVRGGSGLDGLFDQRVVQRRCRSRCRSRNRCVVIAEPAAGAAAAAVWAAARLATIAAKRFSTNVLTNSVIGPISISQGIRLARRLGRVRSTGSSASNDSPRTDCGACLRRPRGQSHASHYAGRCRSAESPPGMAADQAAHVGGLGQSLIEILANITERGTHGGPGFGRLSPGIQFQFQRGRARPRHPGRTGAAGARVVVHNCGSF